MIGGLPWLRNQQFREAVTVHNDKLLRDAFGPDLASELGREVYENVGRSTGLRFDASV